MLYILKHQLGYYARKSLKILNIILIGVILISAIILLVYKPVYKVEFLGQNLGYIKDKDNIEKTINEYINTKEGNIAYIILDEEPEYELKFIKGEVQTSEEELLLAVKEKSNIIYRVFAISLDGENKAYVNSIEEAETIVNEIKEERGLDLELDIGINEIYTENLDIQSIEVAKSNVDEEIQLKESSVNGIALYKPLKSGVITSRFGSRSLGYHTGLDIAEPTGTPIYACNSGTVTYAGRNGSYGNLVIISHGNGVETYYAHCSRLLVSEGEQVEKQQKIAEVGSTGRSTGPHLHLEIRLNGEILNPRNYLYK